MDMDSSVNPQMLTLGRQSRGLTQAQLAARIKVQQGTISKYESGVLVVSEGDLQRLAKELNFPVHFFLQNERIKGPEISEQLFHRKRQSINANALRRIYALAEIRRIEIQKLFKSYESSESTFPRFPVDEYDDDCEKIARTIRALWQIPSGPIFSVTKTIEQGGGIIFQFDIGTKKIDGFSHRSDKIHPIFFLNKNIPPDRWRWTLAHELGHILMHFDPTQNPKEVEDQANRFAGEFLAPGHELKPQLFPLDFQKLAGLKRIWKISIQALIMRAYHLNVITERQRRHMFMLLSKAGYRIKEPEDLDPPLEPPEIPYRLVRFHQTQLGYSHDEIKMALAIEGEDLETYYHDPLDRLN